MRRYLTLLLSLPGLAFAPALQVVAGDARALAASAELIVIGELWLLPISLGLTLAQRLGHGNRVHFLGPQQDVSPI